MRIAYLHQYFVGPDAAGGTRSYEMARRLIAAGHEVDLITTLRKSGDDGAGWQRQDIDGIRVHALPVPYSNEMGFAQRVRAFLRFAIAAARRARSVPADLVFATSTPLTIALPGVFASRRQKVPMVFEVRDLWPEMPIAIGALKNPVLKLLARRLEKFAYRNAKSIIALSDGMAAGVRDVVGDSKPVITIPNGCDVELFGSGNADQFLDEHAYLRGGPIVMYTGTLGRVNGVSYLVEIAGEMFRRGSDVRFVVIGEGAEHQDVLDAASRAGVLEKNFWLLPPVSKSEMPAALAASTIACSLFIDLPEMWKNSANKFFDALAAGRPVMLNYGGWQAELLRETEAGLVVPPDDAHGASLELESLLGDADRLSAMSRAAARLAREKFDRDTLFAQFLSVLEDAAGD